MNRIAVFASAGLLLGSVGCMVPVGVERDRPTLTPRPQTSGKRTTLHEGPSEVGRVDQLRVNSETVGAKDVWRNVRPELAAKAETLGLREYQTFVEQRAAQLITDQIAEMLLYQQASLRLSPEAAKNIDRYVGGEIRKLITARHRGVQRLYEKHLADQGLTVEDVHEQLRREVIIASHLEREIKPKVTDPTRAELLTVFEANREQWRQPARRKMSLIDLRVLEYLPEGVNNPSRDEYAAARAEALSVIQTLEVELRNGADFAGLARKHSHGLHAAEGGAWGWVTKESVRERFEPALEALNELDEGEVSGVIEASDGFFLVRCDELQPAVEFRFQDVQPELMEQHFRASYNRLIAERVAELRREGRIEPENLELFYASVVEVGMKLRLGQSQ